MSKSKIVKAIVAVLFFGAMVAVGTFTFFSDEEKSTGNVFAAGKLDLIVKVNGESLTDNIFNLTDMKPGDPGEKTVSIKVDDNPACGTVKVDLKSDLDNTCTEPEAVDEGVNCPLNGTAGELNDNLNFGIWADTNCNNIYESGEQFLTQGTLTGDVNYHIGELGTQEKCYGVQWCFGVMTVDQNNHTITCDGSTLNNITQTDSFSADIVVTAEQKRNQYDNCPVDGAGNGNGGPACTPTNGGTEICDGIDNDCDGQITDEASACGLAETSCTDGIDNDTDGAIDCLDPGCFYNSLDCISPVCGDQTCRSPLETFANCPSDCQAFAPAPECTTSANCTDDGKACTVETCVNGSCVRTPNNNMCFNTNSCLLATCIGAIPGTDIYGCAYQATANVGTSCWDTGCGLSAGGCNGYTCNSIGACVAPAPGQNPPPTGCTDDNQCSDNDACTSDYCDNSNPRTCQHTNIVLGSCVFGGSCTNGTVTCNPNPNCPNNCDDNNACTTDSCITTGCTHTVTPNYLNCGNSAFESCNPANGQHYCTCYLAPLSYPNCSISLPSWPF